MECVDCVVVGAGVVGLAVARALALRDRDVLVIESNPMIGNETSSRNNEVVHAGFLYPPDSLRAKFCRPGAEMLLSYCRERQIKVSAWGKLVLALDDREAEMLPPLVENGLSCGVDGLEILTGADVRGREPGINCRAALYSPSTAVVDSHAFMLSLQGDAENAGATVAFNTEVAGGRFDGSKKTLVAMGEDEDPFEIEWNILVNAAGLRAHSVAAHFAGLRTTPVPAIHFAKGSFFTLAGKRPFDHIVVPLGETLAMGGAFTIDPGGQGKFGPDLDWVRERDYRVAPAAAEKFATAVGRYWDGLDPARLLPGYAGIRPRIYGPDEPPGDWLIEFEAAHGVPGLVNLLGIETPGLTASMAVAEYVAETLLN